MADFNAPIIEEFRENDGKVGGYFEGLTMLLLHHVGARSGVERCNPLAYQRIDVDTVAIFGSKGGAPTNPDWYHNLLVHPEARVEIGNESFNVKARVAEGEERERIWEKQKKDRPAFAAYETKTEREIPVIVLERADGPAL